MKYEVSGRMKYIMDDFVREARRSGYVMAEIIYESASWNDEHDKLHAVMTYDDRFKEVITMEV